MENTSALLSPSPDYHRTLRIAVVTETYLPEINGVSVTMARIVTGLRKRHHPIQLIRPRQHPGESGLNEPGYEEILYGGLPIPGYTQLRLGLPARLKLVQLWNRRRPDLVHIVTEGPLGWSALSAAISLNIPVATDFHTNFHLYSTHYGMGLLKRPISRYLRRFHNRAGCTMVPTESMSRELASEGYRNIKVVARGVDTSLFNPVKRSASVRRQWGATDRDPVVIYVGRLAPEKNIALVFEAFNHIRALSPHAKLVLVGDGPARKSLEAQYPGNIFAGMRTGEDLASHYASADIFLFPSLTETYGNVTVEAMASGLAVVAFDYAAAKEHIRHGNNGIVADPGNSQEFIRLATGLAEDPARIAEFRNRARITAEQLSWDSVVLAFEKVIAEVMDATVSRREIGYA